jgi:hypothetical protein
MGSDRQGMRTLVQGAGVVVAALLLAGCPRSSSGSDIAAGDASAAPSIPVEASAPAGATIPPAIRGVGPEARLGAWFTAHGVDRARLSSFVVLLGHDREEASDLIDSSPCNQVDVGAPPEEGLACEQAHVDKEGEQRTWRHARVFVVRKGLAVTVFDVVLSIASWDMPDIRFVDQAVTVEAGGGTIEVGDRAPEGARFSMAGNGAASEIHGCERAQKDAADGLARALGPERSYAKRYLSEVRSICASRGRWSWRDGRFVHDAR